MFQIHLQGTCTHTTPSTGPKDRIQLYKIIMLVTLHSKNAARGAARCGASGHVIAQLIGVALATGACTYVGSAACKASCFFTVIENFFPVSSISTTSLLSTALMMSTKSSNSTEFAGALAAEAALVTHRAGRNATQRPRAETVAGNIMVDDVSRRVLAT